MFLIYTSEIKEGFYFTKELKKPTEKVSALFSLYKRERIPLKSDNSFNEAFHAFNDPFLT